MKKIFISMIAAGALAFSAKAQLFTPESFNGAALGAVVGGIIGHNNGSGHTAEGAGIGAGAGFLLGSLVHQDRVNRGYYTPAPAPVYSASYYYTPGYAYRPVHYAPHYYWGHPRYVTCAPVTVVVAPPPPVIVTRSAPHGHYHHR